MNVVVSTLRSSVWVNPIDAACADSRQVDAGRSVATDLTLSEAKPTSCRLTVFGVLFLDRASARYSGLASGMSPMHCALW